MLDWAIVHFVISIAKLVFTLLLNFQGYYLLFVDMHQDVLLSLLEEKQLSSNHLISSFQMTKFAVLDFHPCHFNCL